jgi:hypothetical protein
MMERKKKMKKRNKIMIVIGSILLLVVTASILLDGTFLNKKYASVWNKGYVNQLESDQYRMIAFGIRSASSHNSQPWLIKTIDQYTIQLYADMNKSLPIVDGNNNQLLMSQGTFIEGYIAGAHQYGYDVEISYVEPNFNQETPLIATITVHKSEQQLTTVDAVTGSTYDALIVDKDTDLVKTLDQVVSKYPGFSYSIIETQLEVEKLEAVLSQGTTIESEDEAATKELLNVFRFTEWQKNKFRYGLSLNTLPVTLKPFIQPIMNFSSSDWKSFGVSSIKQFNERLALQDKYILIRYTTPSSKEYVISGQIYQEMVFEVGTYSLRPSMQVLESFSAMESLNKKFQQEYGNSGEVLMVIGLQTKSNGTAMSNPRHLVEDILIK